MQFHPSYCLVGASPLPLNVVCLFFFFFWWNPTFSCQSLFSKYESESEVAQSCLTLCDPMGCSLPGSSVHGIFQARILEWVAISFSRGSSQPRDWTPLSCIVGRCFAIWATREASTGFICSSFCLWSYRFHSFPNLLRSAIYSCIPFTEF